MGGSGAVRMERRPASAAHSTDKGRRRRPPPDSALLGLQWADQRAGGRQSHSRLITLEVFSGPLLVFSDLSL